MRRVSAVGSQRLGSCRVGRETKTADYPYGCQHAGHEWHRCNPADQGIIPKIRIIGLTMHKDPDLHQAMINIGACACLSKSGSLDKLVETMRSLYSDKE